MTKIESDPNSVEAQKYYKDMEDLERQTKTKRSSQILIKTIRRGNKPGATVKIDVGADGRPLSLNE